MSTAASATSARSISVRLAEERDVLACGGILYAAFNAISSKHGFPLEIPSTEVSEEILGGLFRNPGFYCVIAEADGRVAGSNCLDERNAISGVGPITIDPAVQDGGIGRMLMQAVIDRSDERGFPGIRLVQAGYHARSLSLYTKLGFVSREQLVVLNGVPQADTSVFKVRPAVASDIAASNDLCFRVHGFHRGGELDEAIAKGNAFVAERDGPIRGYTSGLGYFGHSVGESNDALCALLAQAPHMRTLGILAPSRNYALFRWCLDHGMRVMQTMTLMSRGIYQTPDGPYLPSVIY